MTFLLLRQILTRAFTIFYRFRKVKLLPAPAAVTLIPEKPATTLPAGTNEEVMATTFIPTDTFSTDEPLVHALTNLLNMRLTSMLEHDNSDFEIPVVPDWSGSPNTLSANFSLFVETLNKKNEEENELYGLYSQQSNGHPDARSGELTDEEKWVIIISLVPHIYPHYYDEIIFRQLKDTGEYPQLGFVRGKDFRGFIPTGETAFFLLAGNSFAKRRNIQELFQGDHFFSRRKIVWLEELSKGEPAMSGKIILSQDYLDTIMFGRAVPPGFSMNFPAKQIQTNLDWEDLVINDELNEQINDIKSWLYNNKKLEKESGTKKRFRQGFRTLFYGPSGTGKTLTAGLLGKEIKKDVYKIDLSMVVSKYIGQTEKNLELLFARAEDKDWILFFDEADALFGKRTNVRDAHDKYANQEVSYLLQRIEDYNGLVILATNMKNNIDDAFIRRFNAVLKFPFPNVEERTMIWRRSFPPHVIFAKNPADDSDLLNDKPEWVDIPQLVGKYELTGGSIINIVHYACIKAMERRELKNEAAKSTFVVTENNIVIDPVSVEHLPDNTLHVYYKDVSDGIRREMIKEGKPFTQ